MPSLVPLSIHLLAKSWASLACGGVRCPNKGLLLDALKETKDKPRDRGVLTVSNHISVCDDPMLWSFMPWQSFLNPRTMRYVSGASDIMFTSPILTKFFTKGQVIETDRWGGIFQPAIKACSERLGKGDWVHVFPEGKCSQASLNPAYEEDRLFRFKWGVSQIYLNSPVPPRILPMHIAGFDLVYPEPRSSGFLPHKAPRGSLKVAIGGDLDAMALPHWEEWRSRVKDGFIRDDGDGPEERRRRLEFACALRDEVQTLALRNGHEVGRVGVQRLLEIQKEDMKP